MQIAGAIEKMMTLLFIRVTVKSQVETHLTVSIVVVLR